MRQLLSLFFFYIKIKRPTQTRRLTQSDASGYLFVRFNTPTLAWGVLIALALGAAA